MSTSANPVANPTGPAPRWRRLLPGSLYARVTLIIVVGLAIAQLLTFAAIRYERNMALRELMMIGIERDIASSVAILDRLPAPERAGWLDKLERRNYRFVLGGRAQGGAPASEAAQQFAAAIVDAMRPFPVVKVGEVAWPPEGLQIEVRLGDGSSVVVHAMRVGMPVSGWVMWLLVGQLLVLAVCAWVAVRLVTRPLAQLSAAADQLGPDLKSRTLAEEGPTEVAHAARAFNAMQQRIAGYMSERVEILAAISHDLQTPITRMRLRTDLMDDTHDREKFRQDLDAMNALVREGVTYARTLHGATEPPLRIDADALFESMVADYEDVGQQVRLDGRAGAPIVSRPNALRRILMNLIDNALKFGTDVTLRVQAEGEGGRLVVSVLDNGPGIPPDELDAVLKPFYRVESSRNRSTGGTGLGLAIAHQLAMAMGAELTLHNRAEGGLEARLALAAAPAR
ncbi:two-component sensor histidine kinase [Variovorax sp. RO1]|uniref:ATP-binding protein n=1 Tax=Variovorax sp. RO1 TaxID=2066034 RepID=UPI000C71709B|nr:ATP-binding protein [Variovorax sp. RO1]PLC03278.1 two-component sensor histidine kinase [Variovorax sp. RO1]